MKKILRTLGMSAAIAGSLGLGTTPANAAGGGVFTGTASINCFGCGTSTGTADLCVVVWVNDDDAGVCVTGINTTATYTVAEPAGATCVATGTANGTTTGVIDVIFDWTRVGAVAVISTSGDINGSGVAAFKVTSPVGVPCGGPVTAQVVGAVIGV